MFLGQHCRSRFTTRRRLFRPRHLGHLGHCASLLGIGQETGSKKTFPLGQLADLLFQIHQSIGRLLREELPRIRGPQNQGQRDPPRRRRFVRNRTTRGQGIIGRNGQNHFGSGQAVERRFPPTKRLLALRSLLPVLQDRGHVEEHCGFL